MSGTGTAPSPVPSDGRAVLRMLETTLHAHREAMVAGDLPAMRAAHDRIRALLADPLWRDAAPRTGDRARLNGALRATAIDATLAARAQAQASRALASLGLAPDLYTPAGGLLTRGPGATRALDI